MGLTLAKLYTQGWKHRKFVENKSEMDQKEDTENPDAELGSATGTSGDNDESDSNRDSSLDAESSVTKTKRTEWKEIHSLELDATDTLEISDGDPKQFKRYVEFDVEHDRNDVPLPKCSVSVQKQPGDIKKEETMEHSEGGLEGSTSHHTADECLPQTSQPQVVADTDATLASLYANVEEDPRYSGMADQTEPTPMSDIMTNLKADKLRFLSYFQPATLPGPDQPVSNADNTATIPSQSSLTRTDWNYMYISGSRMSMLTTDEVFPKREVPSSETVTIVPTVLDETGVLSVQIPDTEEDNLLLKEDLEVQNQNEYFKKQKLHRWPIRQDGNSLFSAVSQAMFGDTEKHMDIREAVVKCMRENWSDLTHLLRDTQTDKYLDNMAQAGVPGGEPELRVIGALYRKKIEVIEGGSDGPMLKTNYETTCEESNLRLCKSTCTFYQMPGEYFDLLSSSPPPQIVLDADVAWRLQVMEFLEGAGALPVNFGADGTTLEKLKSSLDNYHKAHHQQFFLPHMFGKGVKFCVAKDNDGNWYRAAILDEKESEEFGLLHVLFVDYGTKFYVHIKDTRRPEILTHIPQLSTRIQIDGIKPNNAFYNWTPDLQSRVREMVIDKPCKLHINHEASSHSSTWKGRLVLPDGTDLCDTLCAEGLALRDYQIYNPRFDPKQCHLVSNPIVTDDIEESDNVIWTNDDNSEEEENDIMWTDDDSNEEEESDPKDEQSEASKPEEVTTNPEVMDSNCVKPENETIKLSDKADKQSVETSMEVEITEAEEDDWVIID